MKLKHLLAATVLIFVSAYSIHAQKLKTAEVLGETYGVSYNKADNAFTICENVSSLDQKCTIAFVENKNNTFAFQQALKDALSNAIKNEFEYKILGSNVKLADFNTIDYTTQSFDFDASKLANPNDEIEIAIKDAPEDFPTFKLKKIDASGNYELSLTADGHSFALPFSHTDGISDDTKKAGFIAAAMLELDTNGKDDVAKAYSPKFEEEVEKSLLDLLEELYNTTITKDADYEFLVSELLIDTGSIPKNYSFYQLLDNKKFHIRVCESGNCDSFTDFDNDVSEGEFINAMVSSHGLFAPDDPLNKAALGKVYLLARSKVNDKLVEADREAFESDFKETIAALESGATSFSGQFVLTESIQLYKEVKDTVFRKKRDGTIKTFKNGNQKYDVRTKTVKSDDVGLIVDSVHVHVFNNRADKITMIGKLSNDDGNTLVLSNLSYSLPFREFNSETQRNSVKDKNGVKYWYRYVDVLDYLPRKKYNFAVKNGEYTVRQNDTTLLPERKIGDYFTGIFFSDILGLNSNNGNSLITAEGRIRIPWHFRNFRRLTLLDNITAYASVNLVGGLDDTTRKITVNDTFDPDETSEANAANFRSDNFNLLNNNNIDAGILVTPITFEWKGAATFIHFRYGLRFLRTGVEYNLKERIENDNNGVITVEENLVEERSFQVYSLGQEAEINFEIRPQSLFGADVTVGLNWFRANGTNKNDVDFSTFNNTPNLKVMSNVYAFTDSEESNSGIFLRLGAHYNLGNYKVFPQVMVGYATNLSSFVNKVTKD